GDVAAHHLQQQLPRGALALRHGRAGAEGERQHHDQPEEHLAEPDGGVEVFAEERKDPVHAAGSWGGTGGRAGAPLPCREPPTPWKSPVSARTRSTGSLKARSTLRWSRASSWRSSGTRGGGMVWIRFSSMARRRRATWMLSPPNWRISVT